MIFLAQIQPATQEEVGLWLVIFGGILGIIWLGLQIWHALKTPDPVPPLDEKYATKKEMEDALQPLNEWLRELTERIDKNRIEVRQEHNDFVRQYLESQGKIHDRVNEILSIVSEIKGRCSVERGVGK